MSVDELKRLSHEHPIIFFDGVCNFCNGFIKFVIKHDKDFRFKFCALQEPGGLAIRDELNISEDLETVVLLHKGEFYTESDVTVVLLEQLGGWWNLLSIKIKFFPTFIRNGIYRFIAKNRYRIFGKSETCAIPSKEDLGRYIVAA